MTRVFLSLLHSGLLAGAAALAAAGLRWGFRRLRAPAALSCVLWLVVLLRMVVPAGLLPQRPAGPLSWAGPAVERGVRALAPAVSAPEPPAPRAPAAGEEPRPPAVSAPAQAPRRMGPAPADVLAGIWLAGALAFWACLACSWLRLRLRLRAAVRVDGGGSSGGAYWVSDRVASPFVFGLLRPRIYLPPGLEGDTLEYILRHERRHIRRRDYLLKLLFLAALGLHWYNPALWLAWVLLGRDVELACDEAVLRELGDWGSARGYSAALLSLAAPGAWPGLPPGFGEIGVKERVLHALRYRRPAIWARVLLAPAALLALVLLLTGSPASQPKPAAPTTPAPTATAAAASPDPSQDPPRLDLERLRIRYPGSGSWTNLDGLIPVPKAWAHQTVGGRNQAADLVGVLENVQVCFLNGADGWLTYSTHTNMGPVDALYLYRTRDGGRTWAEIADLSPAPGTGVHWHGVNCLAFADEDHGVLATGLFNGSPPIFHTTDGGVSWSQADIPLPEGAWQCTAAAIWPEEYLLTMTAHSGETCTARSLDQGETWQVFSPIADPEQIPLEELPWPSHLGAEEVFTPDLTNFYYEPVKLLGFSADRTAAVFAFDSYTTGLNGLMLCVGGRRTYYPGLAWNGGPRAIAANPVWGDYDGDGADELALPVCVGTGTGVNLWDLYVFEPAPDGGLTLGAALRSEAVQALDLSALDVPGLPENVRTGGIVQFSAEGGLRASIGVEDAAGLRTVSYIGALECAVRYGGGGLSLAEIKFSKETP